MKENRPNSWANPKISRLPDMVNQAIYGETEAINHLDDLMERRFRSTFAQFGEDAADLSERARSNVLSNLDKFDPSKPSKRDLDPEAKPATYQVKLRAWMSKWAFNARTSQLYELAKNNKKEGIKIKIGENSNKEEASIFTDEDFENMKRLEEDIKNKILENSNNVAPANNQGPAELLNLKNLSFEIANMMQVPIWDVKGIILIVRRAIEKDIIIPSGLVRARASSGKKSEHEAFDQALERNEIPFAYVIYTPYTTSEYLRKWKAGERGKKRSTRDQGPLKTS